MSALEKTAYEIFFFSAKDWKTFEFLSNEKLLSICKKVGMAPLHTCHDSSE